MIRTLACIFGWHWQQSGYGNAADDLRIAPHQHRTDALGEYLRSTSYAELTPEVLLRIL